MRQPTSLTRSAPIRSVRPRRRRRPIGRVAEEHAIGHDRLGDVLHRLPAERLESQIELALDLVVDIARDADPAGLRQPLQARGDVDAVAEDVVAVDDDVAHVDADTKSEIAGAGRHRRLHRHRACHCIDRARELCQHAVASGLDDAAFVLGDGGIDELVPQRP